MSGPSRLEREAELRRALLRGAKHSEPGLAHTRVDERVQATARIAAATQQTKERQP